MKKRFTSLFESQGNTLTPNGTNFNGLSDYVVDRTAKSELILSGLDVLSQLETQKLFKKSKGIYSKSLFIQDFDFYVRKNCTGINKDILKGFYKLYEHQDWIEADGFIDEFKRYINTTDVSSYYSLDFLLTIESISIDGYFGQYLKANSEYRYLRYLSTELYPSFNDYYNESPVKYALHEYFDLVSTLKKGNINSQENRINIIFLKTNQNEKKSTYRVVAFLNGN